MRRSRRLVALLALAVAALLAATTVAPAAEADRSHRPHGKARTVGVQLLSFNDFHGNLEPPTGSGGRNVVDHAIDPATGQPKDVTRDAGGVEYLARHLAQARKRNPNTLTVAAGDLVGATPLLSAAFYDEPTVEAMDALGLDAAAVGNHEFDQGYRELQRKARGGCVDDGSGKDNRNSCPDGRFRGARFDYLAANVTEKRTGRTILPAYTIKRVGRARIGVIGMTLRDTPGIVTASGVAGLAFADEVRAANRLVPVLRRKGVNAIVVAIHQGGTPEREQWKGPDGTSYDVNPTYDYACGRGGSLTPDSPILPIASKLSPAIDVVVSGHTHQPYVCSVRDPAGKPRLVTSASSQGRLFTDTDLRYDLRKRDFVRTGVRSRNVEVTRDVAPAPALTRLIARYKELARPIASKVLGRISADVTRTPNAAGETALGDLIADAQLADGSTVTGGQQPVVAFMNPGGIRADLTAASSPYGEPAGDVTYDEAFTVQPFSNYLVSLTMTGQQIYDLLAQQVSGVNAGSPKILQVSKGFAYRLGSAGAVDGSVTLNGTPLDKAASYRVVTNNFLADGGDGFAAFQQGTGRYVGGLDIDAFAAYLTANSPYSPGPLTRITR